jgi:hypothetical protein
VEVVMLENLKKVRELLANPEHWYQHWYADTGNPHNEDAMCFCPAGAYLRVIGKDNHDQDAAEQEFAKALGFTDASELFAWNDEKLRTHADVLELLDRTIAKLEAA